jgi:hypothetical protein
MKQKIKNIGKKYLVPALLAGSVALGSYGCKNRGTENYNLSVNPEVSEAIKDSTRSELEAKTFEFYRTLDNARKAFNESISDRHFSIGEQDNVISIYKEAVNESKDIREISDKFNFPDYKNVKLSPEDSTTYELLREGPRKSNYNPFSVVTKSKLQKAFEENKLKVNVDKYNLSIVAEAIILAALGGLYIGLYIIHDKYSK